MNQPPTEPNADARVFASALRQMYLALIQEGFTTAQALTIVSEAIRASINNQGSA